jgi:hypothetical protein
MSIVALIFLTISATSYSLDCVTTSDGEPIKMSFDKFKSDEFKKMIESLPPIKYDHDSLCHIQLYMNYNKQSLTIKFTEHLEESTLENQHVEVDLIVIDNDIKDGGVRHVLEYACSDDKCEKKFINKYIDWFVEGDYSELQEELVPFIFDNDKQPGQ